MNIPLIWSDSFFSHRICGSPPDELGTVRTRFGRPSQAYSQGLCCFQPREYTTALPGPCYIGVIAHRGGLPAPSGSWRAIHIVYVGFRTAGMKLSKNNGACSQAPSGIKVGENSIHLI